MTEDKTPRYANYHHYINEGWSTEPKYTFQRVAKSLLALESVDDKARVLDIGCATGEFIAYLAGLFPNWDFVGIDIFDELISKAGEFVPDQNFVNSDYLELDETYNNTFDVITAVGVLSLFSGQSIDDFWQNSRRLLKPTGTIVVLGPMNEFGIDMDLKHRKWVNGERKGWERGWSIPSQQSVELAIQANFSEHKVLPYEAQLDITPREDPIRTWTVEYANKPRQLTNGLKLLVDYYLIEATKPK